MKTSQILQRAKAHLTGPGECDNSLKISYICYALNCAARLDSNTWDDCRRVKSIIQSLLGEHATLERWLEVNHGIVIISPADKDVYEYRAKIKDVYEYRAKMQATRHAWVNSLIAEYRAKGD